MKGIPLKAQVCIVKAQRISVTNQDARVEVHGIALELQLGAAKAQGFSDQRIRTPNQTSPSASTTALAMVRTRS